MDPRLLNFAQRALGVPFVDHGRDFAGWDCWGLVVAAYRECLDIDLSSYDDISALDKRAVIQQAGFEIARWRPVARGQEEAGQVILLRPCHVGLIIEPGRLLHVAEGTETCLVNYRSAPWKDRIVGIYKYNGQEKLGPEVGKIGVRQNG